MQFLELSQIYQNVKSNDFFIVDKKVFDLYKDLRSSLKDKKVFFLDNPEEQKNLETYEKAISFFIENGISRKDKLIAIGGGATSDFAGFVAATILRGIKWEIVPTTLLAMVDASIGGKVGINSHHGKNLIGAFHLPEAIHFCPDFLSTLPTEEFLSGKGEILKYCFLDEKIYQAYQNESLLKDLVSLCADYKEALVKKDLKENDQRKILNLGHTFGHAIEKTLHIPHGLAVIIGLKLIIDIYANHLTQSYHQLLEKFDLNTDIPVINFDLFWNYLTVDKKRNQKGIDLVIPVGIGKIEIVNLDLDKIKSDLKSYKDYATFFQ